MKNKLLKKDDKPIRLLKAQINFGTLKESCPFCIRYFTHWDALAYRESADNRDTFLCSFPRRIEVKEDVYRLSLANELEAKSPCLKSDWTECPFNRR